MFMEIRKIPYDVWYDFDRIRRTEEESDKRFVGYHSDFYDYLVKFEFIELDQVDDRYNFYKTLPKFSKTPDGKILEEICGKSIREIMMTKVIEAEDIPDDFEDLIYELVGTDGYFDKVDIYDQNLSNILRFHGYTTGAGVNGHYSAGTEKLMKTPIEKVIETITGASYSDFLDQKKYSKKAEEIALMKELAAKYGYEVMLVEDYIELMGE